MNKYKAGFTTTLLAALGGQQISAGPGQVDWPPSQGYGYGSPAYLYQPAYGNSPPPPPAYNNYDAYSRYRMTPRYPTHFDPQIDYVAPPEPDWSPDAVERTPVIEPGLLIRDESPGQIPLGVDAAASGGQASGHPGASAGLKSGEAIEVVPPPNLPLNPDDVPVSRPTASGWRPHPEGRILSQ